MQQRLRHLSLEDLMNLTVTSVSKQAQSVTESAAAVFVLTQNDIHRSGATSIPEALRTVPGLQVTRIDASQWSVTARGFGGRYANKLLVLIDGRSVYTPIYGGVDWDEQDLLLEDIERIEVIRGPGASLWGANAVNGVINIITQPAADTPGGRLIVGLGNELRSFGSARFGASINDDLHYRAYIKATERDNSGPIQGQPLIADGWRMFSGGFKFDWQLSDTDQWTVDGRAYRGKIGQTLIAFEANSQTFLPVSHHYPIEGGHLLSRWQHDWSPTSEHQLQIYYNQSRREDSLAFNRVNTFDVDFQHYFLLSNKQTLTWGLGYRHIDSKVTAGLRVRATPKFRQQNLYSGFLQSEWTLFDEQLKITLGSKFEHTFFTGFEMQPSAKLLWSISPQHILWSSISRAVRTPSISERDGQGITGVGSVSGSGLPASTIASAIPNTEFDSEQLISYELGYRFLPKRAFSLDVTAYYNVYRTLRSVKTLPLVLHSTPNRLVEQPFQVSNDMKGYSYGAEASVHWSPYDDFQLSLAYTFNRINIQLGEDADNALVFSNLTNETRTPQQQITLQSSFDLPLRTYLDIELRYTDRMKHYDSLIKANLNLDIRMAWRPVKTLELSWVGQNLIGKANRQIQRETFPSYPSNQERSVYFKLDWHF